MGHQQRAKDGSSVRDHICSLSSLLPAEADFLNFAEGNQSTESYTLQAPQYTPTRENRNDGGGPTKAGGEINFDLAAIESRQLR